MENRRSFLTRAALGMAAVSLAPAASDQFMTITAASGARQTLIAMGAGFTGYGSGPRNYSTLPRESRLDMAQLIWGNDGLGFRVCRLWGNRAGTATGAQMLSAYKTLYDDINSVQPRMMWQYAAWGYPARDGLEAYAAYHAQVIADCKAGGLAFQYVGTCNEPGSPDPVSGAPNLYLPAQAAELVKEFRTELDKRGLQDVGIVSPECANVDRTGMSYVQNIKDDPAALAALAGFDSHSYNMSFTPEYYDLCNVPGKQSWQDESAANGPEGPNDAALAAGCVARACNDFNFGCNIWMHFEAYLAYDPNDNATRIMGYDPASGAHQPFLKYYYYRQLRRGFKDGCVFRSSTSSDTRESVYQEMCMSHGDRPAIIGATGRNVDGSWGLSVVNLTGEPDRRPGVSPGAANYQPSATYKITYHVAELADAGRVRFRLCRSSATARDADQGTVSMRGGNVIVTIAPLELVTLVSAPTTKMTHPRNVK
ncbi:MAG: hypothetical protein ABSC23_14750 [Bryobacteraceae bacterium]|jgi:hypothetical protein